MYIPFHWSLLSFWINNSILFYYKEKINVYDFFVSTSLKYNNKLKHKINLKITKATLIMSEIEYVKKMGCCVFVPLSWTSSRESSIIELLNTINMLKKNNLFKGIVCLSVFLRMDFWKRSRVCCWFLPLSLTGSLLSHTEVLRSCNKLVWVYLESPLEYRGKKTGSGSIENGLNVRPAQKRKIQ